MHMVLVCRGLRGKEISFWSELNVCLASFDENEGVTALGNLNAKG